jgi:hypothetical protein
MEKLLKSGKAKAIGVSNCDQPEMLRLVNECSIVPAVHQMECHPWLQQHDFAEWHRKHGIHVTHYSPLGNQNTFYGAKGGIGKLIDEPVLAEIGKQYEKTAAQVALGRLNLFLVSFRMLTTIWIASLGSFAGSFSTGKVQNTCKNKGQFGRRLQTEPRGHGEDCETQQEDSFQ